MPLTLTLRDQIIGSHAFFAREGATIDSVTVSSTVKPDAVPETNWTDNVVGSVEDCRIIPQVERIERVAPSPGRYTLRKRLTTKRGLVIRLTIQELSQLFWELLLMSGTEIKTGALDYQPLAGDGVLRGWMKFQQYDQDDTLRNAMDLWCEINTDESTFNNSPASFPLEINVLENALNTGTYVL